MAKILVAMSGGVDSSVAAAMLQREGHEVVGCFMRLGSPGDTFDELDRLIPRVWYVIQQKYALVTKGVVPSMMLQMHARFRHNLGSTFYVCNFKKDFGRIIDYFVDEYEQGRTRTHVFGATTG